MKHSYPLSNTQHIVFPSRDQLLNLVFWSYLEQKKKLDTICSGDKGIGTRKQGLTETTHYI